MEESIAWQLGGSPNTLGITLQQQHLFYHEQKAGGDASFYSFYAVLHHMQGLWDHLAQRITPCDERASSYSREQQLWRRQRVRACVLPPPNETLLQEQGQPQCF